ncbi:DUF6634 family protein [Bosea sp. 2KB_26]|uniref:DUF6634 family protein n=1 Tax=Bosea sp. 2KB_26 TaxID=3237475 RepID=UPI003F8FA960
MSRGHGPTRADLVDAPTLYEAQLTPRPVACLAGLVDTHPLLRGGPIVTSAVVALDPAGLWARTLSRFYNLANARKFDA